MVPWLRDSAVRVWIHSSRKFFHGIESQELLRQTVSQARLGSIKPAVEVAKTAFMKTIFAAMRILLHGLSLGRTDMAFFNLISVDVASIIPLLLTRIFRVGFRVLHTGVVDLMHYT